LLSPLPPTRGEGVGADAARDARPERVAHRPDQRSGRPRSQSSASEALPPAPPSAATGRRRGRFPPPLARRRKRPPARSPKKTLSCFKIPLSNTPNRSKTRGLGAGRKLKTHRRNQRWADKDYNKANLGSEWRKPFAGASHAKGIVLEKIGIEAKQPNSAIRKCARVQLIKNGKKIAAFVPMDGCLNFIEENDEVLIAGFGRRGHAVGDIPGVRFKVVKVAGVALIALFKGKKEKPRS